MSDLAEARNAGLSAPRHGYRTLRLGPFSRRLHLRRGLLLLLLVIATFALALYALGAGSQDVRLGQALAALTNPEANVPALHRIVSDLRLPRILLALACGAMLGLSGASLQSLTRNGLADPGLLGVREGASLAILLLLYNLPGLPLFARPVAGIAGGVAAAAVTIVLCGSVSRLRFILTGIGVSWFLSAIVAMVLLAADADKMQTAMVWLAGNLAASSWHIVALACAFLVAGAILLFLSAAAGDAAQLGDGLASGLGVNLKILAGIRLLAPILLTAACVSVAGSLGFVGLIAPHLARLSIGGGQIPLLAASGLWGAILVLAADTLGRTLFAPLQLPAGIVLAAIGVPALLLLLWRRRHQL